MFIAGSEALIEIDNAPTHINRKEERRAVVWSINDADLKLHEGAGLLRVGALMGKRERTELESVCVSALRVLDKSITASSLDDRLVFTFSAAETLLLKDPNEPIQALMGLRLAYLAGQNPKERKAIVDHLRKGYLMRSLYLHHGRSKREMEVVRELVNEVRLAILHAIAETAHYRSKAEFMAAIEQQILTG